MGASFFNGIFWTSQRAGLVTKGDFNVAAYPWKVNATMLIGKVTEIHKPQVFSYIRLNVQSMKDKHRNKITNFLKCLPCYC